MIPPFARQWTDSDAWQPGYVQRLETTELIKLLAEERRQLRSVVEEAHKQSAHTRELRLRALRQGEEVTSTMEGIGAVFGTLKTTLEDESFVKGLEAAAAEQQALEKESLELDDIDGGTVRVGGKSRSSTRRRRHRAAAPSAAARVRAKQHRNRTSNEKRWVALDAVVNPRLYHHVTLAEAEEMRWDTLYYTRLDREDILRVLSLPPQVQLALPLLHTPDEVAAHELLSRYTLGISADHFARLDRNSQDICLTVPTTLAAQQDKELKPGEKHGVSTTLVTPVAEEYRANGASPSVLASMRRAAEAQIKILAERDEEEAIWLALDKKMRPDLYHDDDEAAGERHQELYREADAREDARHTWLRAEEKKENDGSHGATGTVGDVVNEKRKADDGEAETRAAQQKKREALAARVADAFGKNELMRLADGMMLWGGGPAAATGATRGARGLVPAVVSHAEEVENKNDIRSPRRVVNSNGGRTPVDSIGGDGGNCGDEMSSGANSLDSQQATRVEDENPQAARLKEIAQQVMSRYFVREEETPLGRDMTRSLAMLQEVTVRLCKGQRDVFSGLNQQTAFAALLASAQRRSSGQESAIGVSATVSTNAVVSERGEAGEMSTEINAATITAPVAANQEKNRSSVVSRLPLSEPRTENGNDGGDSKSSDGKYVKIEPAATSSRDIEARGIVQDDGSTSVRGDIKEAIDDVGRSRIETKPKIFGSWEEIHPASLGKGSQEIELWVLEKPEGTEERMHPASFRAHAIAGMVPQKGHVCVSFQKWCGLQRVCCYFNTFTGSAQRRSTWFRAKGKQQTHVLT